MKRIVALFIVCMMAFCPGITAFAENEVSVYLDGDKMYFDVPPVIINGSTMVPVRKIFEELGAEVTWHEKIRRVNSKCGDLYITLEIDSDIMTVGNDKIILNQAPVILESSTLVPLRAIAEAFKADVSWDNAKRQVDIKTKYPKKLDESLTVTLGENYSKTHMEMEGENIQGAYYYADVVNDGIKIRAENAALYSLSVFRKKKGENTSYGIENACWNTKKLNKVQDVEVKADFSEIDDADALSVWFVYSVPDGSGDTVIDTWDLGVIEKNGKYEFYQPESLVYQHNKKIVSEWKNPAGYLITTADEKIRALSDEICFGCENDYEKILKIHDWVCENIYYDLPSFFNSTSLPATSATAVVESKKTVCEGYANLIKELVTAQGIPCLKVHGYALGIGEASEWNETNCKQTKSNHAWNRVYVDNRWINVDATWDSGNKYIGSFEKGPVGYDYFDCTDLKLSDSHKYLEIN